MIAKVGDVLARDRGGVDASARAEKVQELAHHLLVTQRSLVCARLAFLRNEMLEPLRDTEHAQAFAVDALQNFAEQIAGSGFGQRTSTCLVRSSLQSVRHFESLAL